MDSSYPTSYSDQNVNVILPIQEARALFNSLFAAAAQPCSQAGEATKRDLEPSADFSSSDELSDSSSNDSANPSPSQLLPALQLSASTLCPSDFPTASDRGSAKVKLQGESDPAFTTPSPRTHPGQGSWTPNLTESHEVFEKHMQESMPKVQQACKRLHRVLGLRNEDPYEPPQAPVPSDPESIVVGSAVQFNPALKHLRGATSGLGIKIGQSGVAPIPLRGKTNSQAVEEQQQQVGIGGVLRGPQMRPVEKPLTLRERLLMYGRQPYGNQVKTELRSLTFHDLTPDMRTGGFKNEMLAHFEADIEGRTRLVSYEVDVPVPARPQPNFQLNSAASPLTERWLFTLISTPLVAFKLVTTSNQRHANRLPPNMPTTNNSKCPPNSWLLFAAPLRAIRSHLPTKDHIIVRTPDGGETFRPVKRYDYDYSFNGIPNFEFMDKSSVLGPALGSRLDQTIGGPFLCGRDVAAYEPGNDFITKPRTESGDIEDNKAALREEDKRRWEDVENLEQELSNSWWWNECRGKFYEDRNIWMRIKDSMARSCCRVVLRVQGEAEQHQRQQLQREQMQHEQQQGGMVVSASGVAAGGRKKGLGAGLDTGFGPVLAMDSTPTIEPDGLDSGS